MVFMGVASLLEGKSRGLCLVQLCAHAIQASKRYVESFPLVLKDKRSCFSQSERFIVQLPLDCGTFRPEVGHLIGIWKPSIVLPSPQTPANLRFDRD